MFVLALFLNDVSAIKMNPRSANDMKQYTQTERIDLNQPVSFISKKELEEDRRQQLEY